MQNARIPTGPYGQKAQLANDHSSRSRLVTIPGDEPPADGVSLWRDKLHLATLDDYYLCANRASEPSNCMFLADQSGDQARQGPHADDALPCSEPVKRTDALQHPEDGCG